MLSWLRSLFVRDDNSASDSMLTTSVSRAISPSARPETQPRHDWLREIPTSVVFLDVETTGLHSEDRLVSLGAIKLMTEPLLQGSFELSLTHLIFNPEKRSHPRAEAVHGYDHATLRSQDRFKEHAAGIRELIHSGDLVVAHNASFDIGFINREFERLGSSSIERPVFCTMEAYRQRQIPGSSSLDAVCSQFGMRRMGNRHGALEDAWLAMNVYLWLHGCPHRADFPKDLDPTPSNLKRGLLSFDAPTLPASSSSGAAILVDNLTSESSGIDDLVDAVKQAKRSGNLANAENLLLKELDRQEMASAENGHGVAPWYYEQLAIVYLRQKRYADELKILERYDQQIKSPGARPAKLKERLLKARERNSRLGLPSLT